MSGAGEGVISGAIQNGGSAIVAIAKTGAGQWGSSLALAGQMFGIDVRIYMVKISYQQKPYRRALMETWGAEVDPSPTNMTEAGRAAIEYALQEFMGGEARGPLKVLEAPGHSFSDVAAKVVHIINLGTIAELAEAAHKPLHPVRFRANLYLEDLKPWSEFDLIGKKIRAGGVTLKVTKRVERCAAVDVDPDTAQRDTELPQTIWRKTGDTDCGIYASVVEGGAINEGDRIEILD